uniref:Uncharacterized protein n=1 Tax=viral metagenome TaxID=1070528 RepID=A0A6M3LHF8_9ZZZZ
MGRQVKTDEEMHPEWWFNSPTGHIRDRIIIHDSPEIPKEGLFVSLNGYPFHAPTGVEIDIPRPVRKMLDTLIRTETIRVEDGKGGYTSHVRDIKRVNYTLVKEDINALLSPEAIDKTASSVAPQQGG